jgi:hypothetical protein
MSGEDREQQSQQQSTQKYRLPSNSILAHASKLAIVEDRPIMLDYWVDSLDEKALIGVRENGEKLLVKNEEEYTSPIAKVFKVDNDYLVTTENSIYLVSGKIPTRKLL